MLSGRYSNVSFYKHTYTALLLTKISLTFETEDRPCKFISVKQPCNLFNRKEEAKWLQIPPHLFSVLGPLLSYTYYIHTRMHAYKNTYTHTYTCVCISRSTNIIRDQLLCRKVRKLIDWGKHLCTTKDIQKIKIKRELLKNVIIDLTMISVRGKKSLE